MIYLAALRRSGSTALAGQMTVPGESLILPEPHFFRGGFRIRPQLLDWLKAQGLDLREAKQSWHEGRAEVPSAWMHFMTIVAPHALAQGWQLGVKEIDHQDWMVGVADLRAILVLIRDPRDVYLSLCRRIEADPAKNKRAWRGRFGPEVFADYIATQRVFFERMIEQHGAMQLRYEDICEDSANVFSQITASTGLNCNGDPGLFLSLATRAATPGRRNEARSLQAWDSRSIARWRKADDARRDDLLWLSKTLAGVLEAWGYA